MEQVIHQFVHHIAPLVLLLAGPLVVGVIVANWKR